MIFNPSMVIIQIILGAIIGLIISLVMVKIKNKEGVDTSDYVAKGLLYGVFYGFIGFIVFIFAFLICLIPMFFAKEENKLAKTFLKYIPIVSIFLYIMIIYGQATMKNI